MGVRPPPSADPTVDYGYLARFLELGPTARDCTGAEAACAAELRWLEAAVRREFRINLRDLYAGFIHAYSAYWEDRVPRTGERGLTSAFDYRTTWLGSLDCGWVPLRPEPDSVQQRDFVRVFQDASARCWEVNPDRFEPEVMVAATVEGFPGETGIEDLTATLGGSPPRVEHADVQVDRLGVPRATWLYRLSAGDTALFLLTNVADEVSDTNPLTALHLTFTALESSGTLSTGGTTAAQIDAPLALELDSLWGYSGPDVTPMARRSLEDPCFVQLNLHHSGYGDRVVLQLTHDGPIAPGRYDIFAGQGSRNMRSQEAPGLFTVTYGMGQRNPLSRDGRGMGYWATAGVVDVDAVSPAGLVTGRMRVTVEGCPTCVSIDDVPMQAPPNLSLEAEFSVVVRNPLDRPGRPRPIACLAGGPPPPPIPEPDDPDPGPAPEEPGTPAGEPPGPEPNAPPPEEPEPPPPGGAGRPEPPPPDRGTPRTGGTPSGEPPSAEQPAEAPDRGGGAALVRGEAMLEFLEAERSGGQVRSMVRNATSEIGPSGLFLSTGGMDVGLTLPPETLASCTIPPRAGREVQDILRGEVFRADRLTIRVAPEVFEIEMVPADPADIVLHLVADGSAVTIRDVPRRGMTMTRYDVGGAALSARTASGIIQCEAPVPVTFQVIGRP